MERAFSQVDGQIFDPRSSEVFIPFFLPFFSFIRIHLFQISSVLFIFHYKSFLCLKFFISAIG